MGAAVALWLERSDLQGIYRVHELTSMDFMDTPTFNVDHYHGIIETGALEVDHHCYCQGNFQMDSTRCSGGDRGGSDVLNVLGPAGPEYKLLPKATQFED